jgi:mRNA-degrading endonuclease RelE of RelBE toxin-antitoxin system
MLHRPIFLGCDQAQIGDEKVTFKPLSDALRLIDPTWAQMENKKSKEEFHFHFSIAPKLRSEIKRPPPWYVAFTKTFQKSIDGLDSHLKGRILNAITKITDAPTDRVGDTVKPLTRELEGYWRYRIGDYRLLYFPDLDTGSITIQEFSNRGDIYD